MKPDQKKKKKKSSHAEEQMTELKAPDIGSQREMPKAHGRGVTHPDRRAFAPASCALAALDG